ncbi:hypothetical protein BGX38DRAFT_1264956 [Terfezia claveryi]|nr:hypothetical protein BGX38DRAFT_1264956 [Terfezia claveryi]
MHRRFKSPEFICFLRALKNMSPKDIKRSVASHMRKQGFAPLMIENEAHEDLIPEILYFEEFESPERKCHHLWKQYENSDDGGVDIVRQWLSRAYKHLQGVRSSCPYEDMLTGVEEWMGYLHLIVHDSAIFKVHVEAFDKDITDVMRVLPSLSNQSPLLSTPPPAAHRPTKPIMDHNDISNNVDAISHPRRLSDTEIEISAARGVSLPLLIPLDVAERLVRWLEELLKDELVNLVKKRRLTGPSIITHTKTQDSKVQSRTKVATVVWNAKGTTTLKGVKSKRYRKWRRVVKKKGAAGEQGQGKELKEGKARGIEVWGHKTMFNAMIRDGEESVLEAKESPLDGGRRRRQISKGFSVYKVSDQESTVIRVRKGKPIPPSVEERAALAPASRMLFGSSQPQEGEGSQRKAHRADLEQTPRPQGHSHLLPTLEGIQAVVGGIPTFTVRDVNTKPGLQRRGGRRSTENKRLSPPSTVARPPFRPP